MYVEIAKVFEHDPFYSVEYSSRALNIYYVKITVRVVYTNLLQNTHRIIVSRYGVNETSEWFI